MSYQTIPMYCAQLTVQNPEDVIAARHSEPSPDDAPLPIELDPRDGRP